MNRWDHTNYRRDDANKPSVRYAGKLSEEDIEWMDSLCPGSGDLRIHSLIHIEYYDIPDSVHSTTKLL
jgi:hypothetical protein